MPSPKRKPSAEPLAGLVPILETALDSVVVMRTDGTVADWNLRAEEAFGWSREETLGRVMADLIIPVQYREAHWTGLQRYLATGEGPVLGRRFEITALRRSGEEFPIELSITAVKEAGHLLFLGFMRDISDRKRNERALARRAHEAELLYRVTALASEISSFEQALQACIDSVCDLTGWPVGHAYVPDAAEPGALLPSGIWHLRSAEAYPRLIAATRHSVFRSGEGLPGHIWATAEPCWISDVETSPIFARSKLPGGVEIKSAFGFPIKSEGRIIAILEFFADTATQPDPELLLTVRAIGEQVGRVFERRSADERLREKKLELEAELARRIGVEQHQELLLAELSHRVKNMLAVVMGIATQTARSSGSVEAFTESFLGRLSSLGRAHSLITARNWTETPLRGLIKEILAPFADQHDGKVRHVGPDILLEPKVALALALILHELATNAAKYGALARPEGQLLLEWHSRIDEGGFRLVWRETGLGDVREPTRKGFGSRLVETSVRHELGGRLETSYYPDGVTHSIEVPLGP